jgi:hypothetical protein
VASLAGSDFGLGGEKTDPIYRKLLCAVAIEKQVGKWYARRDLNPQPPVPKTGALSS